MPHESTIQHYLAALAENPQLEPGVLIGGLISAGCDASEVLLASRLLPIAFGRALLSGLGIQFCDVLMQLDEQGNILGEEKLCE